MTTKSNKVSADEAEANAAAIRQFWAAGKKSLADLRREKPAAFAYGRNAKTYKAEAKRMGMNVDTAAKARRVAEEYKLEAIEHWCRLVKRTRSRFGPTLLLILLRVKDRERRDDITEKAINESWTKGQLTRTVQAERGKRRKNAGRKQHIPTDPVERLFDLDALAEKFLRWCDEAKSLLPDSLQTPIEKAVKALSRVREAVLGAVAAERNTNPHQL